MTQEMVMEPQEVECELNADEFNDLRETLLGDGYEARAPSTQAAEIDSEVSASLLCAACNVALSYRPMTWEGRTSKSYLAFAVCPECGKATEF